MKILQNFDILLIITEIVWLVICINCIYTRFLTDFIIYRQNIVVLFVVILLRFQNFRIGIIFAFYTRFNK